ncbi:phage distal tail protein [Treponema sp.]|uniref:phage distal tail protein n=1 Tax=Treponema sp. TaxID=166 RepID=UPI00388E7F4F
MYNNLSKLFRYVNENGDQIIFNYSDGFLINKPNGIDTVSISLSQANGINQVGATIQSKNIQPRPVTINGYLVGEQQAKNKDRIMSVIRPDLSGRLYADDYYLEVHPTSTPVIEPKKELARFQFSLLAPYPYWMKDDSVSQALSGVDKKFKFPWKICANYRFGAYIETQFMNVQNRGQLPVPFTATMFARGPLSNPKISNAETGQFIQINKNMVTGERLVLEITHERTYLTSSVDGDCRGALSLNSNLIRLDVGDNVLKTEATEGRTYLQVDISFATEIVGITL